MVIPTSSWLISEKISLHIVVCIKKNRVHLIARFETKGLTIFLCNFKISVTEDCVKDNLSAAGIDIVKVRRVSHDEARRRSFVVTVGSLSDFDKLNSGEYIPLNVGVRRFLPRRPKPPQSDGSQTLVTYNDLSSRQSQSTPGSSTTNNNG